MTRNTELNGVVCGDDNFLLPSHMNYGRFLLEQILRHGDKIALINGSTDENITYAEMAQQIVNTAASLSRLGLEKGHVVALCSENRIEFVITAIAVIYAGGVITVFNIGYSIEEIFHVMNIAKPKFLFFSPDAYDKHYSTLKQFKIVNQFFVYGKANTQAVPPTSFEILVSIFTDQKSYKGENFYGHSALAVILYSSGTTGLAKGAKLRHHNLIATLHQQLVHRSVNMSVSPWCTCMGLILMLKYLYYGVTHVFLPKFQDKLYLEANQKYKPRVLIVVPPLVQALCQSASLFEKADFSNVEIMFCGGAPLDAATIVRAKKRFRQLKFILQGYGMTENAGGITHELEQTNKHGSVGKVLAGNVVKVVDIETRKLLGPHQLGELCVKGHALFDGYIGNSAELDEHGFYNTGDIVYYDEEGYFFVVDRLKELIKYKAWQVAPSELESILLQHPAVMDAGVIGVPDQLAGELPAAFVVRHAGADATDEEIAQFVASKVSPWKQLRGGVRFVKEIPKNGSGKILRRKLREIQRETAKSKL